MMWFDAEVELVTEIEGRVVYLLEGCYSVTIAIRNQSYLRPGPSLSPLTLETSNALLPPFGSHLAGLVLVGK